MAPQYQVYALPGNAPTQQVFTVSDGFVPASQTNLSGSNQNFNLTAWMVGLADPGHYGQLDLYETPQGTSGPANADAEISANSTVSKDISLLDTKGSEVLLGETLMVPLANSMVYLRPLYVAATTNPQPQLEYVVAVLGKNVQIDTSLQAVLSDVLQANVSLPSGGGGTAAGIVPTAVAGYLAAAQTDYNNALAALKADNLATFQSDIQAMATVIGQAQSVLGAAAPGTSTTTTTTTVPPIRPGKKTTKRGSTTSTSTTTSTTLAPTSTEPKGGAATTSTSTTLASAAAKS
jgi:hypothetical protein